MKEIAVGIENSTADLLFSSFVLTVEYAHYAGEGSVFVVRFVVNNLGVLPGRQTALEIVRRIAGLNFLLFLRKKEILIVRKSESIFPLEYVRCGQFALLSHEKSRSEWSS